MDTEARIYLKAMKTLAAQNEVEPAPKHKAPQEAMRRSAKVLKAASIAMDLTLMNQLSSGTCVIVLNLSTCSLTL